MAESLIEQFRQQSYEAWETLAPIWAAQQEFRLQVMQPISDWLVEQAGLEPGDTVLELAAGTGETGFLAAQKVAPDGRVISTDFSPQMVETARTAGEVQGVKNSEYRVMDAEHMDLDDDSVDAVICRFGYMLMADPEAALAETRRVLRPDGRVTLAVWGPPDRNHWIFQPGALMVELGAMEMPQPDMPGVFSMADHERIRSLLKGAGFEDPRIEELGISFTFKDYDEYWEFVERSSGPIALAAQKLSDEERARARETLRERMAQYEGDSGFTVSGVCVCVAAQ
jgi:ubiquinone/menaquinone biosynthesis C-methylase UbiE